MLPRGSGASGIANGAVAGWLSCRDAPGRPAIWDGLGGRRHRTPPANPDSNHGGRRNRAWPGGLALGRTAGRFDLRQREARRSAVRAGTDSARVGSRGAREAAPAKASASGTEAGAGSMAGGKPVATAMIDTSDGLSTDLGHICEASGVGARVYAEKIPTVAVPKEFRRRGLDAQELALDGGEDYELLFTVRRRRARDLPASVHGVSLTVIGEITREKKVILTRRDGHTVVLPPRGWDAFRPA